ncbi:MAG TPA: PIN domain-containing protein [Solirubrobacterales bacterium]|nr:PIN domain-containing protein [Solirubrobacterales bacterium]
MITPDTSVLIAGFDPLHPFHAEAVPVLVDVRASGRLVAHTMAETYAVLSSPGGTFRFEPEPVVTYLGQFLERSDPIQPRPGSYREALELLGARNRAGGAVYDALIALAARDADVALVSLDRRAEQTYGICGVQARILGGSG